MRSEMIFVPDVGFRPADTVIARVPVTRAEAGRTVTVERAVSGPSGVEVVLTIVGTTEHTSEMPPFATDPVTLRERSGRVVGQKQWPCSVGRAGVPGSSLETVRREISLNALTPGTREAELSVSGVSVPLELEPGAALGLRSYPLDATVERDGITVSALQIAFTAESTAIELAVAIEPARGHIRSMGMSLGPNACDVGIRDDQGRFYGGQRALRGGYTPPGRRELREVALFPALPADVRSISLEIADVTVTEPTEDLTLPLGFDGQIALGGLTGPARVLRESENALALRHERFKERLRLNGPRFTPQEDPGNLVEVECGEGPWAGDRRLIRPDSVWLADRTRGCKMSFSDRGWVLSVPDPTGDASEVTISSALVQVRGPWTLEITLPTLR